MCSVIFHIPLQCTLNNTCKSDNTGSHYSSVHRTHWHGRVSEITGTMPIGGLLFYSANVVRGVLLEHWEQGEQGRASLEQVVLECPVNRSLHSSNVFFNQSLEVNGLLSECRVNSSQIVVG